MTGEELYAELVEWLGYNPRISRTKVSLYLRGERTFTRIAKVKCLTIDTVRRAREMMRNPPESVFRQPCGRKPWNETRATSAAQRIRKGNRRKALERIEAGLPAGGPGSSAAITCTQRAIEAMVEQNRRAIDPLEQALTRLRRERWTVFRASVYGGRHDHFIIHRRSGDRVVPASEIMRMAERLGA